MKRRKKLSLQFEEEGGHKGRERAQTWVGRGARNSNPAQDTASQWGFLVAPERSFIQTIQSPP